MRGSTMETTVIPARDQATHEIARALADELTRIDAPGWVYDPPNEQRDWTTTAYIIRPLDDNTTERLAVRVGGYNMAGRVMVDGSYPTDPDGRGVNPRNYFTPTELEELPKDEATCSVERGAKVIAKEVVRRVLPGYRVRLAKVLEHHAGQRDYSAKTERAARALATMTGDDITRVLERRNHDARAEWTTSHLPGSTYVKWEVSGDDYIGVSLHGLTLSQALNIAEILRDK